MTVHASSLSPVQKILLTAFIALVLTFFLHQAYLSLFAYTHEDPTRHDARIFDDANDGDPHAQYLAGIFLTQGRQGIAVAADQAHEWFKKSANQDYLPAQFELAQQYRHGNGVEQDLGRAVSLMRAVSGAGHSAAMNAFAEMHARGEGVPKDDAASIALYRQAANQGYVAAKRNLGYMIFNGRGAAKDLKLALQWYTAAAVEGDSVALSNIGIMYEHGQGVKQDLVRAWDCFYSAAIRRNRAAHEHRKRVESKLPRDWTARSIYARELHDCATGSSKWLPKPRATRKV